MTRPSGLDPMSLLRQRRWRGGMTLLEVLIAISILVASALGLIIALRHGGMATDAFSAEHFTAMFLAQKVMEDISDRIAVNPHYFSALVHQAMGDPLPVVDGKSPYFRVLENTENFSTLVEGEDDPIVKASGQLYDQLKNFTCKVDTTFPQDPQNPGQTYSNLIEVAITIGWKDSEGRNQTYRLTQMQYGFSDDLLKNPSLAKTQEFSDDIAIKALYQFIDPKRKPKSFDWKEFTAYNNGGKTTVLKPLGSLLAGVMMCQSTSSEFDGAITLAKLQLKRLGNKPKPAAEAKLKEHIAHLKEQKASTLFYIFSRLSRDIKTLAKAEKGTMQNLGIRTFAIRGKLLGVPVLLINQLMKISLSFASAEAAYKEILIPPHPGIPAGHRIRLIHQWMDVRKLGLLMAEQWKVDARKRLKDHQEALDTLIKIFKGRQPEFIEYLKVEKDMSKNMDTLKRNLAGLAKHIDTTLDVSRDLTEIQKKFR